MKTLGLTGNIGSGKTTVCRIFELLGVPVYYADKRAREITDTPEILEKISKVFGSQVFDQPMVLNRKMLGRIVFDDKKALDKLNQIIHPIVKKDFKQWLDEKSAFPYVIQESAILIETGNYRNFDFTVLVSSPEPLRIERVMQRDGRSREEVEMIINNQLAEQHKSKLADYIILNDEENAVIPQVIELHNNLKKI